MALGLRSSVYWGIMDYDTHLIAFGLIELAEHIVNGALVEWSMVRQAEPNHIST